MAKSTKQFSALKDIGAAGNENLALDSLNRQTTNTEESFKARQKEINRKPEKKLSNTQVLLKAADTLVKTGIKVKATYNTIKTQETTQKYSNEFKTLMNSLDGKSLKEQIDILESPELKNINARFKAELGFLPEDKRKAISDNFNLATIPKADRLKFQLIAESEKNTINSAAKQIKGFGNLLTIDPHMSQKDIAEAEVEIKSGIAYETLSPNVQKVIDETIEKSKLDSVLRGLVDSKDMEGTKSFLEKNKSKLNMISPERVISANKFIKNYESKEASSGRLSKAIVSLGNLNPNAVAQVAKETKSQNVVKSMLAASDNVFNAGNSGVPVSHAQIEEVLSHLNLSDPDEAAIGRQIKKQLRKVNDMISRDPLGSYEKVNGAGSSNDLSKDEAVEFTKGRSVTTNEAMEDIVRKLDAVKQDNPAVITEYLRNIEALNSKSPLYIAAHNEQFQKVAEAYYKKTEDKKGLNALQNDVLLTQNPDIEKVVNRQILNRANDVTKLPVTGYVNQELDRVIGDNPRLSGLDEVLARVATNYANKNVEEDTPEEQAISRRSLFVEKYNELADKMVEQYATATYLNPVSEFLEKYLPWGGSNLINAETGKNIMVPRSLLNDQTALQLAQDNADWLNDDLPNSNTLDPVFRSSLENSGEKLSLRPTDAGFILGFTDSETNVFIAAKDHNGNTLYTSSVALHSQKEEKAFTFIDLTPRKKKHMLDGTTGKLRDQVKTVVEIKPAMKNLKRFNTITGSLNSLKTVNSRGVIKNLLDKKESDALTTYITTSLVHIESEHMSGRVSGAGAVGLTQMTLPALKDVNKKASRFGLKPTTLKELKNNPNKSLEFGMAYFRLKLESSQRVLAKLPANLKSKVRMKHLVAHATLMYNGGGYNTSVTLTKLIEGKQPTSKDGESTNYLIEMFSPTGGLSNAQTRRRGNRATKQGSESLDKRTEEVKELLLRQGIDTGKIRKLWERRILE